MVAKIGDGYARITPISPIYVKATATMTSDTTPSGEVSASSHYDSNRAEWYAFSSFCGGDIYTWTTEDNDTTGAWIQYEFPEAVRITKVATVNRNATNVRAVGTFKLQGSNDGITYADLQTCTITSNAGHYRQEFEITNNTPYLYYRLLVISPYDQNETNVGFAKVELYKQVEI